MPSWKDLTMLTNLSGHPIFFRILQWPSLWTESKALVRSMKVMYISWCCLRHFSKIWRAAKIMSVVPRPARKSHWLPDRITPVYWTCNDSRLSTTRAIIWPAMESSEIPRWLSQQALFPFQLNVHYPGILEIPRNRFLVPCPFTQLRETLKQLFTAMLADLISDGIESALGDLSEDICWIVHRTSATNGGWPIYELPRPMWDLIKHSIVKDRPLIQHGSEMLNRALVLTRAYATIPVIKSGSRKSPQGCG